MILFSYQAISPSPSVTWTVSQVTFILFLFLIFSTEPGQYPDTRAILSIYLRDTNLEDLPYVTGYCGEFGILQQAGPRRIPVSGMCESLQIFCIAVTITLLLTISLSDAWGLFGHDRDHTRAARRSRRDARDREAAAHLQFQVEAGSAAATFQPTSHAYTRV